MPSRPSRTAPPRPLVWVGGAGLPGGAAGRALRGTGAPLYWMPLDAGAETKLDALVPRVVFVEAERLTRAVRGVLAAATDLRRTAPTDVYLVRGAAPARLPEGVDGCLRGGDGLAAHLRLVLAAAAERDEAAAERERLRRELRRLRRRLRRLRHLVVRDDLTSLYNLRFFNRTLDAEHSRATRFGRQYSLIFIDLDGLREVNTLYGHLAGASVLRTVGHYLDRHIRRIDIAARVGGDEFVVICPETSKVSARILAERLRQGIEALAELRVDERTRVTASLGIASFPEDGDLPSHILDRADRALYEAKEAGRNRVCCWGEFHTETLHTGARPLKRGSVEPPRGGRDEEGPED